MSTSSTLDPDAIGPGSVLPPGHDVGSLGPSDLSDSGSDSLGPSGLDPDILGDTGDSTGTGVDATQIDRDDRDGGTDIGFDRIVGAGEAGLGSGLDQAEEGRLGITDEEIDPRDEAGASLAPATEAERNAGRVVDAMPDDDDDAIARARAMADAAEDDDEDDEDEDGRDDVADLDDDQDDEEERPIGDPDGDDAVRDVRGKESR